MPSNQTAVGFQSFRQVRYSAAALPPWQRGRTSFQGLLPLGRLGVLVDLALGELRQGLVRLLFLGEGRLQELQDWFRPSSAAQVFSVP